MQASAGLWRNLDIGLRTRPYRMVFVAGGDQTLRVGTEVVDARITESGQREVGNDIHQLLTDDYFSDSNGALQARKGALQATKGALQATKSTTTFFPMTLPLSLTERPPASSSIALRCGSLSSNEIGPFRLDSFDIFAPFAPRWLVT